MSRPAPLEIHITRMDAGVHHASLYDPNASRVLANASATEYDTALQRMQDIKRLSRHARRRVIVKSNRPPVALALLRLMDAAEPETDAQTGAACTFLPLAAADVRNILRAAVIAIEGGGA